VYKYTINRGAEKRGAEKRVAVTSHDDAEGESANARRLRGLTDSSTSHGPEHHQPHEEPDSDMQVKVKGITANRYSFAKDMLDQTQGANTPRGYSGIASLAYSTGFPAWLSLPLFVYAPASLNLTTDVNITRSDGSHVQAQDQTDDPSAAYTAYQNEAGDSASSDVDQIYTPRSGDWSLQTYLDIEPVSGATIRAHQRLMASFAVPQMDPGTSNPAEGSSVGSANTYEPSLPAATDVLSPNLRPMVVTPIYYLDQHSQISDSKARPLKIAIALDHISKILLYVLTPVGAILLLAAGCLWMRGRGDASAEEPAKGGNNKDLGPIGEVFSSGP